MTSAAPIQSSSAEATAGDFAALAEPFGARGYAVLDFSTDAETLALCDRVVEETRTWLASGENGRVQDAWRRSPAVRALATHPMVLNALQALFARKAFAFQTLNFEFGTEQALHSDAFHFRSNPDGFMCGVWFALEDIREDAGPLLYVPGSHKEPVIDLETLDATDGELAGDVYASRYEPAIQAIVERGHYAREQALLKKGQALVWAANLIHGGDTVRNPSRTRRSQVTHYFFEGCDYLTPRADFTGRARVQRRLPVNVKTGMPVWPTRDGRPMGVPWPVIRATIGAGLKRYVHASPAQGERRSINDPERFDRSQLN